MYRSRHVPRRETPRPARIRLFELRMLRNAAAAAAALISAGFWTLAAYVGARLLDSDLSDATLATVGAGIFSFLFLICCVLMAERR